MTRNKKMIISAVLVSATALAALVSYEGSTSALIERFPNVDPKILRKAHKQMIKDALAQKLPDATSDEDYDKIFLSLVEKMSK
jgi:hypothetical protein